MNDFGSQSHDDTPFKQPTTIYVPATPLGVLDNYRTFGPSLVLFPPRSMVGQVHHPSGQINKCSV